MRGTIGPASHPTPHPESGSLRVALSYGEESPTEPRRGWRSMDSVGCDRVRLFE